LLKIDKYKEKFAKYQGKCPGSFKILNKDEGEKDQEREQAIKNLFEVYPHTEPYIEDLLYVEFEEGSLALIWDKRKGKPKYDMKSEIVWLRLYAIKKKYEKGTYYLSIMDERKMSLSFDGSILQPYVDET
jgi:hypothetical protein